jgi:hypothetical protein
MAYDLKTFKCTYLMDVLKELHNNLMLYQALILLAILMCIILLISLSNKLWYLEYKFYMYATPINFVLLLAVLRLYYFAIEINLDEIFSLFNVDTDSSNTDPTGGPPKIKPPTERPRPVYTGPIPPEPPKGSSVPHLPGVD